MAKELTHRASELQELGWSTEEVARYIELWDYRQRWGAINLEREDRQFLRKAESSLPKIVTGKIALKKPTREKSYYLRLSFFLQSMMEAETGFDSTHDSLGLWPIILEEELRLIDYYQPVLGLPDSLKAKAFEPFREELINKYIQKNKPKSLSIHKFDFNLALTELKSKEVNKWRQLREEKYDNDNSYPLVKNVDQDEFRTQVRMDFGPLFLATLPSLAEIDKPEPTDDWVPD